jgi:hypothetical protein
LDSAETSFGCFVTKLVSEDTLVHPTIWCWCSVKKNWHLQLVVLSKLLHSRLLGFNCKCHQQWWALIPVSMMKILDFTWYQNLWCQADDAEVWHFIGYQNKLFTDKPISNIRIFEYLCLCPCLCLCPYLCYVLVHVHVHAFVHVCFHVHATWT